MHMQPQTTPVRPRKLSRRKKLAFVGLAFCLGVVVCELLLQAAATVLPRIAYRLRPRYNRIKVPDPVLGYRLSPYFQEHDARGYRNSQVPTSCDVLAIGDSQTYGYGTDAEHSWPRQLEDLGDLKVYNAGVGGYGPCEYQVVLKESLPLQPRIVLLGLYVGNDISDAYKSIYMHHRFGHLRTKDQATLQAIGRFNRDKDLINTARSLGMQPVRDDKRTARSIRAWVAEYSSVYGVCREVWAMVRGVGTRGLTRAADQQDSFATSAQRPHRVMWDADPRFRTVFRNPELDALAVDLDDPRIGEGMRVTHSILLSMRDRLARENIRFIVVLLPNKQMVYAPIIDAACGQVPPSFGKYVDMEKRLTDDLIAWLKSVNIQYVQTTDALRACFGRGVRAYHESDDHHPNRAGYSAIAHAVLTALQTSREE